MVSALSTDVRDPGPHAGLRPAPASPVLYQLNPRVHLAANGNGNGNGNVTGTATLDAIKDETLDRLAERGVDWLYLLGVWQTGPVGRAVSATDPAIRAACRDALPDLTDEDICGSCFAVTGYRVHEQLGGDAALARLRARLARRGIRLMLDFVPNHTAIDHPWVMDHRSRYVAGTEAELAAEPHNWIRIGGRGQDRPAVLAYGRDPFFPGWPDTLQLDYSSADVHAAMGDELLSAASRCDGLRCDMAMLALPDVFERTWGRPAEPFWPRAIEAARDRHPGFTFMAEVYWDREYELQQQGFDFTYDKRLYDRLVGDLGGVRPHLCADPDFQLRSARFLENHDEPRATSVFGPSDRHRAAAVVTYLCPGLRFFHDGQFEGRRIHIPVHLRRGPTEPVDPAIGAFYADLVGVLGDPAVHSGAWQLLDTAPAWAGNASHLALDVSTWWEPGTGDASGPLKYVVVANLSDHWSQAYVPLPLPPDPSGTATLVLADRLSEARHTRAVESLRSPGLYLDLGPWAHHVFEIRPVSPLQE